MTFEEAEAILGPEVCAELDRRRGPRKPLTPEQISLLVGIFTSIENPASATDAA